MPPQYDYKKYAVLYVDDEEQALKYFAKTFAGDFDVRTAQSAAEGWKIVQEEGEGIGVLITDQRMPAQRGTDLMEQVRARWPDMVRILTTAYSDLDSAIEAVNAGGAFRYVTKPWNLNDLKGTLLRAMEHFLVLKDRERLVKEKLHVLQRMMVMDRVRGLAALATAVGDRLRNAPAALQSYVLQAPLGDRSSFDPEDVAGLDLWSLARTEGENLVSAVQEVLEQTLQDVGDFRPGVHAADVARAYTDAVAEEKAEDGVTFRFECDEDVPELTASEEMLRRLVRILTERIADMDGDDRTITIRVSSHGSGDGVRVLLMGDDSGWLNGQVASLYSAVIAKPVWPIGLDMDVLAAFFIAHHHGGTVTIHREPPLGPGFEVVLACDPESVDSSAQSVLDAEWFDTVFNRLEEWDEAVVY
jgi:two-component system probable response regulator PhcQ